MKKAVMYGAGNIGRGFIGQLLSLSGYEVVFLDINGAVIDKLNQLRCYPLRLVQAGGFTETIVENVRGVNAADGEAAVAEIASADLLATAVGAGILPKIAPVIARGLQRRWLDGNSAPLNILICENLLDAHKVLEGLLLDCLDPQLHELLHERTGLVEASIGRMVPVPTAQMQQGNLLTVWAEPYDELPVDLDGFVGPPPAIVGLKPFSPFAFYIGRKLYLHNMSHAVLAYLGRLAGHEFIWQAVRDKDIAGAARGALDEAAAALSGRHGVPMAELSAYTVDLMARFDNPLLGDTVARVGRDTPRKLAPGDRLTGAATLCLEQGIVPERICAGIAAALLFQADGDMASQAVCDTVEEMGLEAALSRYCGIDSATSPLVPLIKKYYQEYSQKQ
jgi:mannitol-1-phosphate 5-dehydrogenase